ncbi:MAG TPA: ABC transporter ATP-binding protein [Acidimicrobiales bacterium]|nr:ABC transporter ATP-binding protein [Acidimicrobiales bacterium]
MTPVLRTDALGKDYDETVALEDLSVSVGEGERVIVVGPNGSGKTTLLRITAGLLEPTSGRVVVAGAPPGSLPARAATSFVPDAPVLYDDLSVLEHLEYVGRLHGNEAWEDSAGELVERLGLEERVDDLPARFSRGLRQKTSIALGLVRPFSLLLVDEPFVGLDAGGRLALLELLDESAAAGAAVVVATHQLEFVDQASRCLGLRDGRLVYDGPATPGRVERLVS